MIFCSFIVFNFLRLYNSTYRKMTCLGMITISGPKIQAYIVSKSPEHSNQIIFSVINVKSLDASTFVFQMLLMSFYN